MLCYLMYRKQKNCLNSCFLPLGQKKPVILFPDIGRVKNISSLTRLHNRICIRIYIFNLKKKQEDKKQKKLKKKIKYPWKS